MVKITLEKKDIEDLITAKYPGAKVVTELDDELGVVIRVAEFKVEKPKPSVPVPEVKRLDDGTIDADATLALKNRKKTIPGGPMGQERGRMRTF